MSMLSYAYSGASDDTRSLGGGLEELGVGLDGGADDEGVGIGEFGGEPVLDLVGRDYVPAGLLLEDGEGGGRDFFCENDLQGDLSSVSTSIRLLGPWFFFFAARVIPPPPGWHG